MHLPEELGRYVQSFLRPKKHLTPALSARMTELNLEFEPQELAPVLHSDHTDRTRFVIYSSLAPRNCFTRPSPTANFSRSACW